MSQSESFDAFYARTSWNVTNQMQALAGGDPLADHAIREAYAKAYQQWYEVSTSADPVAWVLDVAKDAFQRRQAEAAALGSPGSAAGHDPLSWPGMWRPTAAPAADPDATLDPRPGATAGPGAAAGAAAAGALGSGAVAGGANRDAGTSDWFTRSSRGSAVGGDGPPGWPDQPGAIPTASLGEPAGVATMPARAGMPRPARPTGGVLPRGQGSRRNLLIVAAAVVVLLGGGVYVALSGGKSRHGATPPGSGPVAKKSAHMLGAGQTGSRSAIPWSLIAPGWTLAEVSRVQPASNGSATGNGTNITYLVDPLGGKYLIQTTSGTAPQLVAWSGDAKEALYAVGGAQSYGLLTLASGQMTPLQFPAGVTVVGFTRPNGLNILAVAQTNARYRLERFNLAGTYQATIGTMPRTASATVPPRFNALNSPDGTIEVWGVDGDGMQVVGNRGELIRKLRMLGTSSPKSCTPISWWSASEVLAYCGAAGQPGAGRLWLAAVEGGQPTALTGISGSPGGQGLLTGAWQAGGQVFVTSRTSSVCQGAPSGPGGQQILQVSSGGTEAGVRVPASTNNYASVVAGVDGRLLVLAQTSCPGTSSLISFNPATRTVQTLLTAPSTEAGVVSAVPYGSGPAAMAG
jgi:TolB protein